MVQLCTCNKLMKPKISLVCKKSPCFPLVKNGFRTIDPKKNCPNSNPNPNANPNSNPSGGQFSSRAIVQTPVKTKETKNRK